MRRDGTPARGYRTREAGAGAGPRRGRSLGIWVLVAVNLALAAAAFFFLRYLAGAEKYLLTESADFGAELQSAQTGIAVMRVGAYVLLGGFLLSALGILSLTRIGRFLQLVWALLLCLSVAGLVYGVPVIVLLLTRGMRERFSRVAAPAPGDD